MIVGLALVVVAIWLGLLFGHHGFWRNDQVLGHGRPRSMPPVAALVPARNEAATIGACVASLIGQDYAGELHVVVIDDGSDDGTAALATAAGAGSTRAVHVVTAPPKPPGWSGKLAALECGRGALAEHDLDAAWLWLTDADIVHEPDVLTRLMAEAETRRVALASIMVRLATGNAIERWLAPAFVYFFQLLYPFRAVNDPAVRVAAAAGGCILVDRAKFERSGGFAAIHDRLIDDVALARLLKANGCSLWLGTATACRSLRRYDLAGFVAMVARTAFTELRYSYPRLVLALFGLALVFLAPLALVGFGNGAVRLAGLVALAAMAWSYLPTLRAYDQGALWALTLPAAALAYMAMTLLSAWRHGRGTGATWHGRRYAP